MSNPTQTTPQQSIEKPDVPTGGLLLLSRRVDETIVLDFSAMTDEEILALRTTPIEVMLCELRSDKARLGTRAPKSVQVHRREIYDAIQKDKAKAQYAADRHAAMVARG